MGERVMLFNKGDYPQGDFNEDRVKKIFENTKDNVTGIFNHSDDVTAQGHEVLELATFKDFELNDGKITAEMDLNDTGQDFYDKGALHGCSIEIRKEAIKNVSLLSVGTNCGVPGTEFNFSDSGDINLNGVLKFCKEEVEEVETNEKKPGEVGEAGEAGEEGEEKKPGETGEEVETDENKPGEVKQDFSEASVSIVEAIEALDVTNESEPMLNLIENAIWKKKDIKYWIDKIISSGYEVTQTAMDFKGLTPKEVEDKIREKLNTEAKFKADGLIVFKELKDRGAITPAMEKVGLDEKFFGMLESQKEVSLNFSDQPFNIAGVILEGLKNLPQMIGKKSVITGKLDADFKGEELTGAEKGKAEALKFNELNKK